MQKETVPQSHVYSAYGHALSGRITRPLDHIIEVQAGMSLPSIGGIGNARVEDFRFKDFVSFKTAYTHVAGSMGDDEVHTSLVTSTIESLNVLDIVTADRVVARLASRSKLHDKEPQITVFGSKIDNLKIAGCAIDIKFADQLFLGLTTFESIRNEFDSNPKFRKIAADPFLTGQPKNSIDDHGVVVCSLLEDMPIDKCPGVKRIGHAFEVPEFGRVYVGELFAQHRKRTLTMLRLELGCPVIGTIICAQAAGNGYPAG
jgi:hypothetical protein